jgi:phosphate transport system substrate-binding protein
MTVRLSRASARTAIGFMFKRVVDAVGAPVRVLPIAMDEHSAPVAPSNASFFDGSYPFHNNVYLYLNKVPGQPLPGRVREFARFILSREGQAIIAAERRFIPLNAQEVREELAKLDQ